MIKTGNPVISIYTEMTPNPETIKFVANKLYIPAKALIFLMWKQQSLRRSLLSFSVSLYQKCFIASNFVTLAKTPETEWQDVIPSTVSF
jgi:hypothetical protein